MEFLDKFESEYKIEFIKPLSIKGLESLVNDKNNVFYKIYILIRESCKFKKVRMFFILRALNELGLSYITRLRAIRADTVVGTL